MLLLLGKGLVEGVSLITSLMRVISFPKSHRCFFVNIRATAYSQVAQIMS